MIVKPLIRNRIHSDHNNTYNSDNNTSTTTTTTTTDKNRTVAGRHVGGREGASGEPAVSRMVNYNIV